MDDFAPTLDDLVARFSLRGRAPTDAFRLGVRLAHAGCVTLTFVDAQRALAQVLDQEPLPVELRVENAAIVGRCPCPPAASSVCRHQVAVAHMLWVTQRASRGAS